MNDATYFARHEKDLREEGLDEVGLQVARIVANQQFTQGRVERHMSRADVYALVGSALVVYRKELLKAVAAAKEREVTW